MSPELLTQLDCSGVKKRTFFLGLRKFILSGLDLERNLFRRLKSCSPPPSCRRMWDVAGKWSETESAPVLYHSYSTKGFFHPSLLKGFTTTGILRGCWICAHGQRRAGCGCCFN